MKNEIQYASLLTFAKTDKETFYDYTKLVKGRSFLVCQEHYNDRATRKIIYTDTITLGKNCTLCKVYC